MSEPSRSNSTPPTAPELTAIDSASLDRFVPAGTVLAVIFTLLLILYGRW